MTVPLPTVTRRARWLTAVALVMAVWLAGLPVAYLLILLALTVQHLLVPVLFVAWALVSVLLTLRVRRRARDAEPPVEGEGRSRAEFGLLRQRAALLVDAVLLVGGPVGVLVAALGGIGYSIGGGAQPGLLVVIVGGFLLLAAAVPTAVLNALWTLDPATAAQEAAVLRGDRHGARRLIRAARTIGWITSGLYGLAAVLLLVEALRGAF